ncbi:MAG: ComEC/Rec2 family competence protein [Flammeovirgaceae bacterium]
MKPSLKNITWNHIPFIRLTFFLILGILYHIHSPLPIPNACWIGVMVGILYFLLHQFSSKKFKRSYSFTFGITGFAFLFLCGYGLVEIRTAQKQENHIIHQGEIQYYKGQLISETQQKSKSKKTTLAVEAIYKDSTWVPASGKVLLYLSNQDTTYHPKYGDILMIRGHPKRVKAPANPAAFDYQAYLAYQNIYHQHFLRVTDYQFVNHSTPNRFLFYGFKARQWADHILQKYLTDQQSYSIATALILGVKDHLDDSIKSAYASAGAMHVLAVSGLHVGIIFQLFGLLFKQLKRQKWGRLVNVFLSLTLLWSYAMLTGFSASVLRAVSMFSLIIIAQNIDKQTNIYNTLSLSAFALLCWNPYLIMGVGFQLSYAAVFGIVFLQPYIANWFHFKQRIFSSLWELTAVSIAAQLATFPIGLLYFHQFPTYFWLANFFVIPVASLILYLGIGLLVLGSFHEWLGALIGNLLNWLIWALNQVIQQIQHLPHALIERIDISIIETWLVYAVVLAVILFLIKKRLIYFYCIGCTLFLLIAMQSHESYQQAQQKSLVVYHINKHANLSLIDGGTVRFLADSSLLAQESKLDFHIKNHLWEIGVNQVYWFDWNGKIENEEMVIQDILHNKLIIWNNKRILYYREACKDLALRVDYLICSNNALKSWEALADIHAKCIIFDATNRASHVRKLLKTKPQQSTSIQIHNIADSGAFIKELN